MSSLEQCIRERLYDRFDQVGMKYSILMPLSELIYRYKQIKKLETYVEIGILIHMGIIDYEQEQAGGIERVKVRA
jgi:hypothetical protein